MQIKRTDEVTQAISTIREYETDIEETKLNIKTKREQLKELVERKSSYREVEELTEVLAKAREKLKNELLRDGTYTELMEDIADDKATLADQQDILSQHIAFYWKETGERQVEMDDNTGDAREIVITGKLGKEGKFQTNLFADESGKKGK